MSEGVYASLNCGPGSSDRSEHVAENRRRAVAAVTGEEYPLLTLRQTHSARVVVADSPFVSEVPEADALVTKQHGLALGILTADCAPVLFCDPQAGVIAAAHAGWKGAIGGIIAATVDAMVQQGAERARIRASIGPAIAVESYEVGEEMMARFCSDDSENRDFFRYRNENQGFLKTKLPDSRIHFNLSAYVADRLVRVGLREIDKIAADTYAEEARFFSYRRATHRKENDYGRQLSAIVLRG